MLNNRNSSACKGKNTTDGIILFIRSQYVVEDIYLPFRPKVMCKEKVFFMELMIARCYMYKEIFSV